MGEWCSSATIAAVEAAKKYEIPFLVQISTADNIGKNGGKYTFQSAMQNVDTVKWMASMMLKNLHFNSIAIMAENNDFGNSFLSNMDQAMTGVGKKVVLKLTPDRASTNYLGELTRLKDANPDVIAFTMTQTAAANFIRTAKEKGITAQLIGHYPPPPVLFERAVGNAAIGLTRVTFFAESEKNTPKQKEWVRKFKTYYKEKANQDVPVLHWYVVSYDGIYLITDAIKRGGTDKAQWAAAMEKSDFDGVLGRYQFDANRQAKPAGLPMVAIKDVPGEGDIPKLEVLDWK
jgi:branched-chain amino acid transport system substrate-binding protein